MSQGWSNFCERFVWEPSTSVSLDVSRMDLSDAFLHEMQGHVDKALQDMRELERGAIANPDENRMVGHYWLRDANLAPTAEIRNEIEQALAAVKSLAARIHSGELKPPTRQAFRRVLAVGIGGSALGPMFVAEALGTAADRMTLTFLDNTDPDGFDRIFTRLGSDLAETLTLVISKSGGTPETLNGMREAENAYRKQGLDFSAHAVAITGAGSVLDKEATNWLARLPMWDWVGGRTSVMSTVGLVPAALQGLDIDQFLAGARAMDVATRKTSWRENPALALALSWYRSGDGRGSKDMVILPYKDRLALFSRYLQQLVMESLGKEKDLTGQTVHQGIAVYGNKGSTDQHAYVQQLRDGLNNFFATFLVVLKDRHGESLAVQGEATSGDFLSGFWQGTREALTESGRLNLTITVPEVNAFVVGALIALYERAVSFYASFVGINAYHQPGVEAGKKAAKVVLDLQAEILAHLRAHAGLHTVESLADCLGKPGREESIFHVLQHLAASGRDGIVREGTGTGARFGRP